MNSFKNVLLLASVASSAMMANVAQAQTVALNDGERQLHGTGATSIQTVLVQELNCVGGTAAAQSLGLIGTSTTAGTFSTISEPTPGIATPSGTFNCSTTELNPGFLAHYVGSGSGAGRAAWANAGTVNTTAAFVSGTANPNPFGTWTTVQYAFADSSATDGDLTTYTGGTGLTGASYAAGGAPIMFPKFVLPVAVAYAPVYAKKGSTEYRFNVVATSGGGAPTTILGASVGGLRMSTATLCGVFNGSITNFKDAAFTADNGGTSLQDATNDTTTRWDADGVPVRLVGRLDKSGTTDIFTRALAAQCPSTSYVVHAETLPYNHNDASLPDFTSVRADSGLRPAATDANASNNAAPTRVGNNYFNRATGTILAVSGGLSSNPAAGDTNGTGRFLVADGSGGVVAAIVAAPDFASASDSTVLLNGKIGYVSADYINGSPTGNTGLFAAAVQNAAGNYVLPSAPRATEAFGSVRAPQADASGAFQAADGRTTTRPTYQGGGTTVAVTRDNPLAWYNVLYSSTNGLQNPLGTGYPITGTTQFLGYTCYKSDTGGDNAAGIRNFLKYNVDFSATDSTGANRTGIFTHAAGTQLSNSGLLARSNIAALPASWATPIAETFLDTSDPQALDLYIRNTSTTSTCNTRAGI